MNWNSSGLVASPFVGEGSIGGLHELSAFFTVLHFEDDAPHYCYRIIVRNSINDTSDAANYFGITEFREVTIPDRYTSFEIRTCWANV